MEKIIDSEGKIYLPKKDPYKKKKSRVGWGNHPAFLRQAENGLLHWFWQPAGWLWNITPRLRHGGFRKCGSWNTEMKTQGTHLSFYRKIEPLLWNRQTTVSNCYCGAHFHGYLCFIVNKNNSWYWQHIWHFVDHTGGKKAQREPQNPQSTQIRKLRHDFSPL